MEQRGRVLEQHGVDILVRKIHNRVEMRNHTDQLVPHFLHWRADRAHDLRGRILSGLGRARGNQVMNRFGLGKPHFAVEESSSGKLARFRLADALREQSVQPELQHRSRTMAL